MYEMVKCIKRTNVKQQVGAETGLTVTVTNCNCNRFLLLRDWCETEIQNYLKTRLTSWRRDKTTAVDGIEGQGWMGLRVRVGEESKGWGLGLECQ